jgi:hypothetical protein
VSLPFSRDQFLGVFADYNESLWPIAVVLWLLTAAALVSLGRDTGAERRSISFLLVVHWLWAAVAYHAALFSAITPAAMWFAGLFLIEAGLLAWYGVFREELRFASGSSFRHVCSRALVAYALIYPAIVWAGGLVYPWMPTFGVPCPTTILTIGFLLAADRPLPLAVTAIPIVWAGIGGSAAFLLGVHADLMLPVAGLSLVLYAAATTIPRRQPS